jgi:hypothetical protein
MSLEPEFEDLVLRLVPGLSDEWQGATQDEIDQIEQRVGRPLPGFYRWFLEKMGRSMGPFGFASIDFSASTVLAQAIDPTSPHLLIGFNSDEVMPTHTFYNLDQQVRDDARVETRLIDGSYVQTDFETLRESFAWRTVLWYRIAKSPHGYRGHFKISGADLAPRLSAVMQSLGFSSPVPTGGCCAIFERHDASIVAAASPENGLPDYMVFNLGGDSTVTLRQVLGSLATDGGLQTKITETRDG